MHQAFLSYHYQPNNYTYVVTNSLYDFFINLFTIVPIVPDFHLLKG